MKYLIQMITYCFFMTNNFNSWFVAQINNLLPKKWYRTSYLRNRYQTKITFKEMYWICL